MRVLFAINTLHNGGAEAHLLLLATGLQLLGVSCEVAFLRSHVTGGSVDLRDTFEAAGIATHYLSGEKSYDPRIGNRLQRLLRSGQWDVVHSHLPRADAAAAFAKLLDRDRVWISTLHHPYDDKTYAAALLIPALARMWRMADAVVAVSEPVRQWAIDRLGVSPDRVTTVVHGIAIEEPARSDNPTPSTDTRGPGYVIGAIGRLEERKGHATLIRAMVPILKRFPDARLRIAGHDPWGYGDVLRRLIAELELGNHVELVGYMSDKTTFFAGIDVFAFASRAEGFGIVLLEAMRAGKPSVVSDISPLKEIITPGISGLLAPLEDAAGFAAAIMSLFSDRGSLLRMGEEGRRRVATEFSQARMVEHTLQVYQRVARARTRKAS